MTSALRSSGDAEQPLGVPEQNIEWPFLNAEMIDWPAALDTLGALALTPEEIDRTLGLLLEYQEDAARLRGDGVTGALTVAKAAH